MTRLSPKRTSRRRSRTQKRSKRSSRRRSRTQKRSKRTSRRRSRTQKRSRGRAYRASKSTDGPLSPASQRQHEQAVDEITEIMTNNYLTLATYDKAFKRYQTKMEKMATGPEIKTLVNQLKIQFENIDPDAPEIGALTGIYNDLVKLRDLVDPPAMQNAGVDVLITPDEFTDEFKTFLKKP